MIQIVRLGEYQMAKHFSTEEWKNIQAEFKSKAGDYGLLERRYGSVLLASFNIRKLGSVGKRNKREWVFLIDIIRAFDLVAIQEVGDDLSGLRYIMDELGPDFSLVVSDQTGVYPGVAGNPERLAFIYRWRVVSRREVASDITFDRSRVLESIADNLDGISQAMAKYIQRKKKWIQGTGRKPKISSINMPVFLSFIRQPYCVSFEICGHPGTKPIRFMAVNAHLYYGKRLSDRRREIKALILWIIERLKSSEHVYAPNFILFGDLNFDYDNPATDRAWSDKFLKIFDNATGANVNVNFPFLNQHKDQNDIFRTNVRKNETYDQIGLFGSDGWVWSYEKNESLPENQIGPDYGMFDYQELISKTLLNKTFSTLTNEEKKSIWEKCEHRISDHMPIWIRLSLPLK